jgi:3-hydroxyacyl-CoA dehydrogenase
MTAPFQKVAVLGAGVMGSGIAAHLANAGIPSLLFDIEKPAAAVAALLKQKPAPLFHPGLAALVAPCAFGTDAARLSECDWIVEAVTERLDVKRRVFETVRANARPDAVVTSNTSGIPIAAMTEGAPAAFRRNFFVTHFFNPVRYMKLLELVAGPDTDPAVFARMRDFGERVLGKGIVVGKDTPNFVANRIGTFGLMALLHRAEKAGFTVEQVDAIFGKPLGRPKSAVFRTADLVGLDTLAHVAGNCHEMLSGDPGRDAFVLPGFLRSMLDRKLLGDKTGGGFYKKVKKEGGGSEILALDLETLEYRAESKVRYGSIGAVREIEDVGARIKAFLAQDDEAARLAWDATADGLLYAARLLGEIADDVVAVDRAMRWGFAWDLGPFETWDAIGIRESVDRMRKDGRAIPASVEAAVQAGGWYERSRGVTRYLDVTASQERKPVPPAASGALLLADLADAGRVVAKNPGATLLDLGDGVLGLQFHTKMNSVDDDIIRLYGEALEKLDTSDDWAALLVGNQGEHFSAGANIMLVLMASVNGAWDQIEAMTKAFQDVNMRAKYSRKPVVTAPHGMTLGGGAEIAMHGAAAQGTGELYMGLVEVGVGLLPAAGGCKETLWRTVGSIPEGVELDTFPFLQKAFLQIGMAKVSTSGEEARDLGYLRPTDGLSLNRDRQIADAKALALGLARSGWRPARRRTLKALGTTGAAAIASGLWGMEKAGQLSEHDRKIGNRIARVLCGGDVPAGTTLDEQRVLDLEREAFLSLCGEEKTQARIQHMLMNGKPLRN